MTEIFDWKARRSGASITIEGRTRFGNAIKIANVDRIEIEAIDTASGPFAGPIAICADGVRHRLVS